MKQQKTREELSKCLKTHANSYEEEFIPQRAILFWEANLRRAVLIYIYKEIKRNNNMDTVLLFRNSIISNL